MRLREVAMEIGKTPSLLYITRSKNREKYDYMFGFDENKYTSLMLFKQHVQELQDNVGELLYEVSNKQLKVFMELVGYKASNVYSFKQQVYSVIDDDNFMKPTIQYIKRLEKIHKLILIWKGGNQC